MKPFILSFLAALSLLPCGLRAETPKPEQTKEPETKPTDFVRFHEDKKGAQLQTAIATYRNSRGVIVDLIGAIHIGDKNYYDVLNAYFEDYDALLYEMVGDPVEQYEDEAAPEPEPQPRRKDPLPLKKLKPKTSETSPARPGADPELERRLKDIEEYMEKAAPKSKSNGPSNFEAEAAAREKLRWLNPMYNMLRNTLALEAQVECIDYTRPNFVHADMTARAFAARQEERGEGFIQLWMRMAKAQALAPKSNYQDPGLLKVMEILCRPDSATELKRLMGRMFDTVETVMSGMEGPEGSVIISDRNKVALEVLMIHLALDKKKFGIFYGAAHLPDMEKRLISMGFTLEKVEWLTAWDLPPEPPPYKRETAPKTGTKKAEPAAPGAPAAPSTPEPATPAAPTETK
jgi:outer membrane biosynthesis protein TonB